MNSRLFNIIDEIYKPNKITYKNNVVILSLDNNCSVVIKKKNSDIKNIYDYLSLRGFNNYVPIEKDLHEDYVVYKYVNDENLSTEEKLERLATIIANMHAKTTYFKAVNKDEYDDIYVNILNNINYLLDKISSIYDSIFYKKYYNSYEFLFMNNYSKISSMLLFSKSELEKWYDIVSIKETQRVCFVHNNLNIDHFIKSIDDEYLLSFDNSKIDSPVLDLISLYKNTYMYKSFKSAFDKYLYHYDLNEDELKLFFINICVFDDFDINKDDEFINLRSINKLVNYVLITDELVRPYYFVDNEEK